MQPASPECLNLNIQSVFVRSPSSLAKDPAQIKAAAQSVLTTTSPQNAQAAPNDKDAMQSKENSSKHKLGQPEKVEKQLKPSLSTIGDSPKYKPSTFKNNHNEM